MLKVLIIEDHALVREGLLLALRVLEKEVLTMGAEDAEMALKLLDANPDIDLVLLDLMLPGTSGQGLLGAIRKRHPAVPVVILSAVDDPETVMRMIRQGASGFVPKTSSTDVLLGALRQVLEGEVYLPPAMRELPGTGRRRVKTLADRFGLTKAQMRVMELLVEGKTNRQIAEVLGVTEGTVKIHVSAILRAMEVPNRSQALLLARQYTKTN